LIAIDAAKAAGTATKVGSLFLKPCAKHPARMGARNGGQNYRII
jgi:hypothetical protein